MVALMDVSQFDTLDISLQDEFDKFLQERGINQTLAYFVPEYAEYKEQKVSTDSSEFLNVCSSSECVLLSFRSTSAG